MQVTKSYQINCRKSKAHVYAQSKVRQIEILAFWGQTSVPREKSKTEE